MKRCIKSVCIAGSLLLAGCFSMDIATTKSLKESAVSQEDGKPIEHVVVSNYGWYLFNWIPLVCGNARPDASFPWKFFSNQVTPMLLHDRLMSHAATKNADVGELVFLRDEKVIFDLPGTDIPIPIPYVLTYREIQFSGVLTQKKPQIQVQPTNSTDSQKKTLDEMNQLLNRLNPEEDKK